jgi:hypothetical protein
MAIMYNEGDVMTSDFKDEAQRAFARAHKKGTVTKQALQQKLHDTQPKSQEMGADAQFAWRSDT